MEIHKKSLSKLILILGLSTIASCGGGAGSSSDSSGGKSGCVSTTVYDTYGYSNSLNGNSTAAIEIGDSVTLNLMAHVTSGCTLTHELVGTLPSGVSFNSTTGLISGTPAQTGVFSVDVHPAASGTVFAHTTIRIDPSTAQTSALTATRVVANGLPTNLGLISLAAVNHGSGEILYGLFHEMLTGHQIWQSTDGGANWSKYKGSDFPQAISNTIYAEQLVLARNGTNLDLLDAGGVDEFVQPDYTIKTVSHNPRLFRFNGSTWTSVPSNFPFVISDFQRPQEYVHSDGSIWIAWGGISGVQIWRSFDNGSTWENTQPNKYILPGYNYKGGICLSGAGTEIRTLWNEDGFGPDFGFWDQATSSWPHSSWLTQHDWPAAPMSPSNCTTFRGLSWAFAISTKPGQLTSHLMYSSVAQGQSTYLYPRRLLAIPDMEQITQSGNDMLYGFRRSNSGTEIWQLR